MRQSQLFTRTSHQAPKNEQSVNAQLLIRAGFIDKLAAGIYTYLPLGLKVLRKIENIIRNEIDKIGGQEVLMPTLTPKENWLTTGRWDALDVLMKVAGADEKEYALGATHEEIVTPLVQKFIFSYKDLPACVYQIQNKFRNELRARSGIIRGREFLMKDLYSFHTDEQGLDDYYDQVAQTYFKIFARCGLGEKTYLTFAHGGTFSKYSHEFQTICQSGEDTIFICPQCKIAVNKELIEEHPGCPQCSNLKLQSEKSVEVGNIFKLKTKYSDAFEFKFKDKDGQERPVIMGCYGIGPSRLMGTVAEIWSDEKGLIWPKEIAPYDIHLLALGRDKKIKTAADHLYEQFEASGYEMFYDDREASAGEKLVDADLIGIPRRLVISEKTLAQDSVELKNRHQKEVKLVKLKDVLKLISE